MRLGGAARVGAAVASAVLALALLTGCAALRAPNAPDAEHGLGLQVRQVQAVGSGGECASVLLPGDAGTLCDGSGLAYDVAEAKLISPEVSHASVVDAGAGQYAISLELTSAGAAILQAMTTAAVASAPPGNQLAIVVDGEVLSAPAVAEPLTDGTVQIAGGFTRERASELAERIVG